MKIMLDQVEVGYSKNKPILNINKWILDDHEKCLLVKGPNGSGKTTFLKLLVNSMPYFSGEIQIVSEGSIIKSINELLPFLGIYIGDSGFSYKHLTLKDNIELFFKIYQPQEILFRDALLQSFNLTEFLDSEISVMSEGQRKRVDLFFCFLNKPSCIIIDEPLEFLDELSKVNFLILVDLFIDKYNTSFIFSTNSPQSIVLNNSIKNVDVQEFQYR